MRTVSDVAIEVGDIEIGAVEIKDGDSDVRAEVHAPNSAAVAYGLNVNSGRYNATLPTMTDTYSNPIQLDVNGRVLTNSAGPTLTGGSKTVTAAGTGEAVGTTLACKSIYIRAKSTNTGNLYVGDSAVDKTSSKQIVLSANDSVTIDVLNRATVYIDVDTSGEGCDYLIVS